MNIHVLCVCVIVTIGVPHPFPFFSFGLLAFLIYWASLSEFVVARGGELGPSTLHQFLLHPLWVLWWVGGKKFDKSENFVNFWTPWWVHWTLRGIIPPFFALRLWDLIFWHFRLSHNLQADILSYYYLILLLYKS